MSKKKKKSVKTVTQEVSRASQLLAGVEPDLDLLGYWCNLMRGDHRLDCSLNSSSGRELIDAANRLTQVVKLVRAAVEDVEKEAVESVNTVREQSKENMEVLETELAELKERIKELEQEEQDAGPQLKGIENGLTTLQQAVRKVRDQRGDDRCWKDLEELYKLLPEGYEVPQRDTLVELEQCRQYISSCHHPDTEYVSPQRRIEELEAEVKSLKLASARQPGGTLPAGTIGHVIIPVRSVGTRGKKREKETVNTPTDVGKGQAEVGQAVFDGDEADGEGQQGTAGNLLSGGEVPGSGEAAEFEPDAE